MQTTRAVQMTRMVAADGMKTAAAWGELPLVSKESWLASLDLIHVRAQASVIAAASQRPVDEILGAWVILGIIPAGRARAALEAEAPV
jgi:hypothetical protein